MKHSLLLILFLNVLPIYIFAQNINTPNNGYSLIQGVIKNEKNGNFLPDAEVTIFDDRMKTPIAQTKTDGNGQYTVSVPRKDRYRIEARKSTYFRGEKIVFPTEIDSNHVIGIENKPGYVFDVTVFDKTAIHTPINSLRDCKVEIYNNTTKEQELTIKRNPKSVFNFPFIEGNHYTILVRKPGYINRRIEAYVNINGCILCFEGMGVKQPDVTDLMSHDNEIGYLLGSIDLDSIEIGKKFLIPNIYYDFDKHYIRPDAAKILDKISILLKDNPALKVELGSHSDSRGADKYNLALSDRRAEAAVNYLVEQTGISRENLTWKGYGETELINSCVSGVNCSETQHQMNRRTELKITGYSDFDPLWDRTLKEIIEDKNLYQKIMKLEKAAKQKGIY